MKKKPVKSNSDVSRKQRTESKKGEISKNDEANKMNSDNQRNENEEFPGYPHYPAQEDILNPINDIERKDLDVEGLSRSGKPSPVAENKNRAASNDPMEEPKPVNMNNEDIENESSSEADITEEDKILLGSDELNADLGEDEALRDRIYPVDMSAEDLDVPGAELDDDNEDVGMEDEENNPYSIGGDRHEDLEEETDPGR